MGTLYENVTRLCDTRGITGSKMCTDIGISRNFMTELRKGRKAGASDRTIEKIAKYFEVTTDEIIYGEIKKDPATKGDEVSQLEVSDFERDVIMLLRSIPEERKEAFVALLRSLQP